MPAFPLKKTSHLWVGNYWGVFPLEGTIICWLFLSPLRDASLTRGYPVAGG